MFSDKNRAKKLNTEGKSGGFLPPVIFLSVLIALIVTIIVEGLVIDGAPLFLRVVERERERYDRYASFMEKEYSGKGLMPLEVSAEEGEYGHVYEKKTLSRNAPIIILIHGGGMIAGNEECVWYAAEELCARGCLVYTVKYALVPEIHVQDQVWQISRQVDIIKEDAEERGYTAEQVSLLGEGSGAALALYTVAVQRDAGMAEAFGIEPASTGIRSVAAVCGSFYPEKERYQGIPLHYHYFGNFYFLKPLAEYLDPGYLAENVELPPLCIVTGTGNGSRKEGEDFADTMLQAGQNTDILVPEGELMTPDNPVYHPYSRASQKVFDSLAHYFKTTR